MELTFKLINLRMVVCRTEGKREYLCTANREWEGWREKEEMIVCENK